MAGRAGGGATISALLGELDIIAGASSSATQTQSVTQAFSIARASLAAGSSGGLQGPGQQQQQQLQQQQQQKSATAILREHRELEKQRQQLAASIVLPPKPVVRSNPLLDQIGESTTEPPTYWKSSSASSSSTVSKKYSSAGKHVSKATQKKKNKGEQYRDKMLAKIVSRGGGK